jgi:hypothetical protein
VVYLVATEATADHLQAELAAFDEVLSRNGMPRYLATVQVLPQSDN